MGAVNPENVQKSARIAEFSATIPNNNWAAHFMKTAAFRRSISDNSKSIPEDDFEYAERCAYWLEKSKERPKNFRFRRRDRRPIILTGHGVSLRIDRGTLLIRNGLTHYPQAREEFRFFRGDLNLPTRILMLDGSGSISFDVLSWLADQKIPFIQLNWRGDVVTVASENGHSANPKMVAAQIAARQNGKAERITRWLISEKLRNSVETLRKYAPEGPAKQRAISYGEMQAENLVKGRKLRHSVLMTEANSAALYFGAFAGMPIKWKGSRPIPADWHRIGSRISALTELKCSARHPFNAMLNFAYAVLRTHVRIQAIAEGLDPAIGLSHHLVDKKRENLVFDLMEPLRAVVDREILEMVRDETFSAKDFAVTKDGVCRLNPQLARRLSALAGELQGQSIASRALDPTRRTPRGSGL